MTDHGLLGDGCASFSVSRSIFPRRKISGDGFLQPRQRRRFANRDRRARSLTLPPAISVFILDARDTGSSETHDLRHRSSSSTRSLFLSVVGVADGSRENVKRGKESARTPPSSAVKKERRSLEGLYLNTTKCRVMDHCQPASQSPTQPTSQPQPERGWAQRGPRSFSTITRMHFGDLSSRDNDNKLPASRAHQPDAPRFFVGSYVRTFVGSFYAARISAATFRSKT